MNNFLYRNKEFIKDAKFGNLPKGWLPKKGKECFKIFGSTSCSSLIEEENGEWLYMKVEDFNNSANSIYIEDTEIKISSKSKTNGIVPLGSIIVSKRGEAIRKNRVRIVVKPTYLDPNLMAIEVNKGLNNIFLKYLIEQMGLQRFVEDSAIPQLNNKDFYPRWFIIPEDENEQKAIATILHKLDETILATKNSINAAEKLKRGTIQNLLSGKLKPDGTWRKKDEFLYDIKAGYYPSGWVCNRFKEFSILQRGKDLTDNAVIPGNVPVVKSNGVQIYHSEFVCKSPGVVTGRSGTIGKVFYIEQNYWPHNTTLYVKDFKGNHPKFIFYFIQSMKFDRYFAGTTVPTLNRGDIHRIRVALPLDIDEQIAISNKIDKVNEMINNKNTKIKKLYRLKKSLMQNLLTGKIRVNVNKIEKLLANAAV